MSKHEEISNRLKEFMRGRYPSVNEFSLALGMSQPSVSSYLNGTHIPGNKVQDRLRSLGCDIEWLMTGVKSGALAEGEKRNIATDDEAEVLAILKSCGIDTPHKARALLQWLDQSENYFSNRIRDKK